MALLMKNGIAYAKSDKIYTRVFEKEVYGGQSAVIFTDELIVPDSTVKFYSSDKDMVLISKKITGHTLKAIVYSTKITHKVKVEVSTPHYAIDTTPTVYGFHIGSSTSNPNNCVTYLEDAEGMTPAAMNFSTGVFNYGSWENAFFMPRPCMLKTNGTVDYYLNKNNYSQKADGSSSDIANDNYDGNAMMEWGKNGNRIWIKTVPDTNDNTSVSVYISNIRVDDDYKAWSFIDNNGNLKEHFYTPIYEGTIVNETLRSLSGKANTELSQGITCSSERQMAKRNGANWDIEVYCDFLLVSYLLILISKSLDTSTKFGNGRCDQTSSASSMIGTGTMNDKGLFWGANTKTSGVKVFGMENQWGNRWLRFVGLVLSNNVWKYKLTKTTLDGSEADDYNFDGTGYITNNDTAPGGNFCRTMTFNSDGSFYDKTTVSSSGQGFCDYFYVLSTGNVFTCRGGHCADSALGCGIFYLLPYLDVSDESWSVGSSLTYK